MDKQSLIMGWLVGRRIAGQRKQKEKVPVAYLYNGVELPPLPEWDREKYPYAVIYEKPAAGGIARYYAFAACKTPIAYHYFNIGIGGTTENLTCSDDTVGYVQCILNRSDSAWDENWNSMTENTTQVFGSGASPVLVWANHDVNYDDSSRPVELAGTLYLAKSEPVPIYDNNDDPDVVTPARALISSDGYILTDSSGRYLISKEDS